MSLKRIQSSDVRSRWLKLHAGAQKTGAPRLALNRRERRAAMRVKVNQ